MEELYIETANGKIPIKQEMIKKYNLKKGTMCPFTNSRIVGKNGEFLNESQYEEEPKQLTGGDMENELILTTSEAIDIAQGADSY